MNFCYAKPRMRSILKDSDSQWSLETLSNLLPSGSMSFTSKMSSNSTPAISSSATASRLDRRNNLVDLSGYD